jgi:hypothetical protein
MPNAFTPLISGANCLITLTQAFFDAKTESEVAAKKTELLLVIGGIQQQLIAAQEFYSAVFREKEDLEKECLRLSFVSCQPIAPHIAKRLPPEEVAVAYRLWANAQKSHAEPA